MNNLPKTVNEVLTQYFDLINSRLPNIFDGFYLYGSISLGAFDKEFSDIDFMAVTKRELIKKDVIILKQIHSIIKNKFHDTDLDGRYIQKMNLNGSAKRAELCLKLLDGKLKFERFDLNTIDAYQLKKYGITIIGQEPRTFNYEVDWNILLKNMQINLNTYWQDWKTSCERFLSIRFVSSFFSLKMIEWAVTGVSRQYFTFREKDIISKIGAGEYALNMLPERWHKIINESMRLRKGISKSYYESVVERRKDTLGYIGFIISESNRLFEEGKV